MKRTRSSEYVIASRTPTLRPSPRNRSYTSDAALAKEAMTCGQRGRRFVPPAYSVLAVFLVCSRDEFASGLHTEYFENLGDVIAHGIWTSVEFARDLRVAFAFFE